MISNASLRPELAWRIDLQCKEPRKAERTQAFLRIDPVGFTKADEGKLI